MDNKQVIECKAAVVWQKGGPLVVEDVLVEAPKAHEVRVKVIASGVCLSDLHPIYRPDPAQPFPFIPGHESSGIIECVGEEVAELQPGDHVLLMFKPQCRKCAHCLSDHTDICMHLYKSHCKSTLEDGTLRTSCRGVYVYQDSAIGTFSQYTTVSEYSVVKIDKSAPLERVCLLACCFPTGYGAAVRVADVREGASCAIWGLGAVGLCAVSGCRARKARVIIGLDTNPDKKDLAMKFGCTHFINPDKLEQPIDDAIRDLTGGLGVDAAIECVGTVGCLEDALKSCRTGGGKCVLVGICPGDQFVRVPPASLIYGKILTGCRYGGYRAKDDIPALVHTYTRGDIDLEPLISGVLPLSKIDMAVQNLRRGQSIRSIIMLHEE